MLFSIVVYIPFNQQGFRLYQEIPIEDGVSLEVLYIKDKKFIVISTKSLDGLITLAVRTKGLDPKGLSYP